MQRKKRGGGRDEPAWAAGRAASARTERRASVLRAGRAEWDDTMVSSSGGEGETNEGVEEREKEKRRKKESEGGEEVEVSRNEGKGLGLSGSREGHAPTRPPKPA